MTSPLQYREVHLEVAGVLVLEHTTPLVDDLVEAVISSWETDVDHLAGVVVGRFVDGVLFAVLIAPVCASCSAAPTALLGVLDEDFVPLCSACPARVLSSLSGYSLRTGIPIELYDPALLPEARLRYRALWLGRDLEEALARAADRAAFLDPSERPRWLRGRGTSPAALLSLVGALRESGDLLDFSAELRAALEPHRETFELFRALPDQGESLPLVLALLFD